jgi:hypothetical protein
MKYGSRNKTAAIMSENALSSASVMSKEGSYEEVCGCAQTKKAMCTSKSLGPPIVVLILFLCVLDGLVVRLIGFHFARRGTDGCVGNVNEESLLFDSGLQKRYFFVVVFRRKKAKGRRVER